MGELVSGNLYWVKLWEVFEEDEDDSESGLVGACGG